MHEILIRHPVAPLYVLCGAAWLLVFVCAFLFPPADPQRSASASKQGAADAGKEDGIETFVGRDSIQCRV
jgi:hypothetical protein